MDALLTVIALIGLVQCALLGMAVMELKEMRWKMLDALATKDAPEEYVKLQQSRDRMSAKKKPPSGKPRLKSHSEVPELSGYDTIRIDEATRQVKLYRFDGNSHIEYMPIETYNRLIGKDKG